MFQLKRLEKSKRVAFIDRFASGLVRRIKKGRTHDGNSIRLHADVKSILIPGWNTLNPDLTIINTLLGGKPDQIKKLNDRLWRKMQALGGTICPDKKDLELIFNYENVISKNKENSYWIANLIERNTCTYCNRQYCFTVERVPKQKDDSPHLVRPEFDHWFAKSDYPMLSLSLYNLIPSCKVCNSSVKGEAKMSLKKHIHPYILEKGLDDEFTFRAILKSKDKLEWGLTIDRTPGSKIDNTIKAFALDEIYAIHAPLEVADLMNFDIYYNKTFLKEIYESMFKEKGTRITRKEAFRMLFGAEPDPHNTLDRPLSKLKRDLLKQLKVIK